MEQQFFMDSSAPMRSRLLPAFTVSQHYFVGIGCLTHQVPIGEEFGPLLWKAQPGSL
jgi:hypothetical protein